jgi:anti-anti-sigma factor
MNSQPKSADGPLDECTVCGHALFVDPLEASEKPSCSHCGHLQWFHTQDLDDAVIINLMRDMKLEKAEIERVGEFLVRSRPAPSIIVNFHNVEFVSSTFLNRLILLRKTVEAADGKLTLCGLNPVIQEIFEACRLHTLFEISG